MSLTHTITVGVAKLGGDSLSHNVSNAAGQEIGIDESFANGATNVAVAFVAIRAKLQSFYMVSDQVITVKTNSSGSPANTFTLAANKPVPWYPNCGIPINTFLAADITSLFVTNASGVAALLQIKALIDPT